MTFDTSKKFTFVTPDVLHSDGYSRDIHSQPNQFPHSGEICVANEPLTENQTLHTFTVYRQAQFQEVPNGVTPYDEWINGVTIPAGTPITKTEQVFPDVTVPQSVQDMLAQGTLTGEFSIDDLVAQLPTYRFYVVHFPPAEDGTIGDQAILMLGW